MLHTFYVFVIFVCPSIVHRVAVSGQRNCPPAVKCPDQLPSNLTCLTLMNNPCPNFRDGVLRSEKLAMLPHLERLSINNYGIKLLFRKPFEQNKELRFLELIGNRFVTLTVDTFDGLKNLETLRILKSETVSLPDNVFQTLTSLKTLQLSATKITTIMSANFSGLSKLQTLDLGFNDISSLTRDVFYTLPAIETVILESNKLASIPRHIFAVNGKLRNVVLKSNQLSGFDPGLGTKIESLDLSHNQLTRVPKVRAKNCNIGYNNITKLGVADLSGVDVTVLDLTGNPITTVDTAAFSGATASLSTVFLVSTNLTSLDESVLQGRNISLELDKNSNWSCECDQLWLALYLQSRPGGPSCGPPNHPGRLLKDILKELEAECTPTATQSPTTSAAGTVSFSTSEGRTSTNSIHPSQKPQTKGVSLPNTGPSNPPTKPASQGQLSKHKTGGKPSTANNLPLVAGVVCSVLLIAGTAAGIFIWKKKKQQQVKPSQYPSSKHIRTSSDLFKDFQGDANNSNSLPPGSTDGPPRIKFQSNKKL